MAQCVHLNCWRYVLGHTLPASPLYVLHTLVTSLWCSMLGICVQDIDLYFMQCLSTLEHVSVHSWAKHCLWFEDNSGNGFALTHWVAFHGLIDSFHSCPYQVLTWQWPEYTCTCDYWSSMYPLHCGRVLSLHAQIPAICTLSYQLPPCHIIPIIEGRITMFIQV